MFKYLLVCFNDSSPLYIYKLHTSYNKYRLMVYTVFKVDTDQGINIKAKQYSIARYLKCKFILQLQFSKKILVCVWHLIYIL